MSVCKPGVNDIVTMYPELALEWHPTLNGDVTPDKVSKASHKKYYWLCKNGHIYRSSPASRSKNRGCIFCQTIPVPGKNDLGTLYPALAQQWHPTKNGDKKPYNFFPGSGEYAWWICDKGHEWEARISSRTSSKRPVGCPFCAKRGAKVLKGYNDLATKKPELANEWAQDLNGSLTPSDVTSNSNRKVFWRCKEGHTWQANICNRSRAKPTGCPYCSAKSPAKAKNGSAKK